MQAHLTLVVLTFGSCSGSGTVWSAADSDEVGQYRTYTEQLSRGQRDESFHEKRSVLQSLTPRTRLRSRNESDWTVAQRVAHLA